MKDILDHGYVDVIESWGSDERIVEAARMSTGKGFNGWGGGPLAEHEDRRLHLNDEARVAGATGPGAALTKMDYLPTIERLMLNVGGANKQAGTVAGSDALTTERARSYRNKLERSYVEAEAFYQEALAIGVPKELARVHLPVGRYSRMRASANMRNWLAFLTLRMDKAAQWEIRQYADAVGDIIADRFPRTWALFVEGRRA